MYWKNFYATPWYAVFEGEGEGAGESDPGESDPGGGEGDPGGGEGTIGEDGKKTFTQEDVNRIMAENKRNLQKKNQELISQLEQAKKAGNLSSGERSKLNERIEALENEMLTKEELAKKEQQKLIKQHQSKLEELTGELDSWKQRYTQSTITREITDAAVNYDAYHPSQIVAMLRPNTRLVEAVDQEGQPTGELTPKVKFNTVDKDGKPLQLDLSVGEAVKQMKDMDEYLNLFKGEGTAGIGGHNVGSGKKLDVKAIAKDPVKYREARKAGKI